MAMSVDGCRLCLGPASTMQSPLVQCFSPVASSEGYADDATAQKYTTVADVLNKHFWFQLHSVRDANAFLCQTCWTKVSDFHQFYQSVLMLYHHNRWQPAAKQEPHAMAIDHKLEIILNEDKSPDCSDDDGGDMNNWYDESFRVNVKQEKVDDEAAGDESPPPQLDRTPVTNSSVDVDPNADQKIAKYFTLKCDLCDVPLANLTIARNHHQQVHKQRGYLTCGCGQRFVRNNSILEHCAYHADLSPHKCTDCCKIFTNATRLASHRSAKHSVSGPPSTATAPTANLSGTAPKRAKTPRAPKSPTLTRQGDELMQRYMTMLCTMCDAGKTPFESFKKLRQHHLKVHGEAGYVECCGKRFRLKREAIEHCKWHENPAQFDCNICGRSFARIDYLRDHHTRRHAISAPFDHQCDQCDKQFRMADQLRYHKRRAHLKEDDRKFECFNCHRGFVFLSHLRNHMRVRTNDGPTFMCDVCAKCFKSKYTYEKHYAIEHGTVAKCKCPECGKWLKHANQLSQHMAQHRSVPSKCEECDHVAPNRRALYMHRKRAHCEPTHKCLVCDRMFKRAQPLREHMAMHAGITDLYTCSYCPQTFRSHANMYKHRRQVHAGQFEAERHAARIAEDIRNTEEAAAAGTISLGRMRY